MAETIQKSWRATEAEHNQIRLMLKGSRGECEDDEPRSLLYRGTKSEHEALSTYLNGIRCNPTYIEVMGKPVPLVPDVPISALSLAVIERAQAEIAKSSPPGIPMSEKPVVPPNLDTFRPVPKSGGKK